MMAFPQNRDIWLLPCRMTVAVLPLHSALSPSSRMMVLAQLMGPCRAERSTAGAA